MEVEVEYYDSCYSGLFYEFVDVIIWLFLLIGGCDWKCMVGFVVVLGVKVII